MIKSKLSPTLESDEYSYFFTMLTDKYEPLNKRWQEGLEKRFNKPFKPIHILPFHHNSNFAEDNFVVFNARFEELSKKMNRTDIIPLIYPEELNRQFSESKFINDLVKKLAKKQGKVFILSFTDVWLDVDDPNVVLLGPDNKVASFYDAKLEHTKTFKKLGMETIKSKVYKDFDELLNRHKDYPFFLSATYSSGGTESKAIFTAEDLNAYYPSLRPINKKHPLIAAELIDDIVSAPNTTAIITGEGQTLVISISDQILRNNQYMGNIYPSKLSQIKRKIISEMTLKVGDYLSKQGYRGLFGMDFLITKSGKCYPVDLNPRRQGGYYCVAMSSKVDLIELELATIFGEPIPKLKYKDFQCDYCWAHSKLTPYFSNMKILEEVKEGDPLGPFKNIGESYKAIYYPKDYVLIVGNPGFYLTSGESYKDVKAKLFYETEKTISDSYELYEG